MATTKKRGRGKKSTSKTASPPGQIVGEINGFPVRRLSVDKLRPADYNPRTISEKALEGLRGSVGEFGLPQPIVWNRRTGNIVGGHQRLKTLPAGAETDVVEVDLDEDREVALNLALNNEHLTGEWTEEVGGLLDRLREAMPDLTTALNLDDLFADYSMSIGDLDGALGGDDAPSPSGATPSSGGDQDGSSLGAEYRCPRCHHEWSGDPKGAGE